MLKPYVADFSLFELTTKSPLVYVWRRGKQTLYVGMSKVGLSRPLGKHPVINEAESVRPEDILGTWYFETAEEAYSFEKRLIDQLRPKYNKTQWPHVKNRVHRIRPSLLTPPIPQ